jgi:hypothetical protein
MWQVRPIMLTLAWFAALAVGIGAMLEYEMTPTESAQVRAHWPADSRLVRDRQRPTLLMFVHPQCPCSRASLSELEILASDCGHQATIQILFVRPPGFEPDWERTDLFARAERIEGVRVLCDIGGVEAARFGAKSSGQIFLFGSDGQLMFDGGITPSRGHEGDSAGRTAVTALILRGSADCSHTPVFGCSLLDQSTADKGSRPSCLP